MAIPTAKAPTNASPAPEVSMAVTARAGSRVTAPLAPTSAAPLAPRVTTRRTPRPAAKARRASSPASPAVPASAANSDSLGISQSVTARRSLAIVAAGAGLRIVIAPRARAAAKAAAVAAWGTSNWPTATSTRSRAATAAAAWSGVSRSFAPGTTMIRLVPSSSTQIGATPLEPGTRRTPAASIPRRLKFSSVRSA